MAGVFLRHNPTRLSLDAHRVPGSVFYFARSLAFMAGYLFAIQSHQAEPGRTSRSGLVFCFAFPSRLWRVFFCNRTPPGQTCQRDVHPRFSFSFHYLYLRLRWVFATFSTFILNNPGEDPIMIIGFYRSITPWLQKNLLNRENPAFAFLSILGK